MTIDIELVCTHAQLGDEVLGIERLSELTKSMDESSSLAVRQRALEDVLFILEKRTPPIYASSINAPSQLLRAVTYGALERLYREAMTNEKDVFGTKRVIYEKRFTSEVSTLMLKVDNGSRTASALSAPTGRR